MTQNWVTNTIENRNKIHNELDKLKKALNKGYNLKKRNKKLCTWGEMVKCAVTNRDTWIDSSSSEKIETRIDYKLNKLLDVIHPFYTVLPLHIVHVSRSGHYPLQMF